MEVFADEQWWVADANPRDPSARVTRALVPRVAQRAVVTTEEVLVETLGFLSGGGTYLRAMGVPLVRGLLANPHLTVVAQSHESFLRGLDLYERRADKGYSLVDCISMVTMGERGITDVLSGDQHFRQEGFVPLIDPDAI